MSEKNHRNVYNLGGGFLSFKYAPLYMVLVYYLINEESSYLPNTYCCAGTMEAGDGVPPVHPPPHLPGLHVLPSLQVSYLNLFVQDNLKSFGLYFLLTFPPPFFVFFITVLFSFQQYFYFPIQGCIYVYIMQNTMVKGGKGGQLGNK